MGIDFPFGGSDYPFGQDCEWTIKRKSLFVLKFLRFDIEPQTSLRCFDYLQANDQPKLCGNTLPSDIYSDDVSMMLKFASDYRTNGRGFKVKIIGNIKFHQ